MAVVVHLSDLHFVPEPSPERAAIFDALVGALAEERRRRGRRVDLLAITGDVFDTSSLDPEHAADAFTTLHGRMRAALGGEVPAVVVPGNHDRRRAGLVGPHREELFEALARRADERTFVHGCGAPFLSSVVPPELHGQPFWVVAYDSTYLPRGLLSAGGVVRQEDVLRAASIIGNRHPDWPVLFLLHHHLVPTPLTDLGTVETEKSSSVVKWSVAELLPRLVANGDREEIMMTAMGAGTALSTLHTLGRAVVVLHGHKHIAAARLLSGLRQGQGDVLLVSAGSGGTAQAWSPTANPHAARLWPSFNVLELDGDAVTVETVSFGFRGERPALVHRPLVWAARRGPRLWAEQVPDDADEEAGPRLSVNQATYRLRPDAEGHRWALDCERWIVPAAGSPVPHYLETVDGLADATLELHEGARVVGPPGLPTELELGVGAVSRYRVRRALLRTMEEARRLFDERSSPFGWVGLMNRYGADEARLILHGLGRVRAGEAFASATDLGTGRERAVPAHLADDGDGLRVLLSDCPPRTLLRIYFPLDTELGAPRPGRGARSVGPQPSSASGDTTRTLPQSIERSRAAPSAAASSAGSPKLRSTTFASGRLARRTAAKRRSR